MNNFQTLDMDYLKQIAERVVKEKQAERAEALRRKNEPQIQPEVQEQEEQEAETPESSENFRKEGYIYVPHTKLYVAKERTLQNKNWEETHREIIPQGFTMQTPYEFMSFLTYLKDSKNIPDLKEKERKEILEDILKVGDYRGEWLNAKYVKRNGHKDLDVQYVTGIDKKGNLVFKQEPLETCIDRDTYAVYDFNKQGLLTKNSGDNSYIQGSNLYFWYPRENTVAGFDVGSDRANLDCYWNPGDRDAGLGVRYVERSADRETVSGNGGKH